MSVMEPDFRKISDRIVSYHGCFPKNVLKSSALLFLFFASTELPLAAANIVHHVFNNNSRF